MPNKPRSKYFFGAYCSILLAELINYAWWFVTLLALHLEPGAANFLPYLIPLTWPVLPLLFAPLYTLAVLASCCVTVALLFRFTSLPTVLRFRRKFIIWATVGFVTLYAASLPLFFIWNLGGV
jgi:hypothetical protein